MPVVRSKRNTSRRSSSEDSNFYDTIHKGKMTKLVPNSKTYALSKNITNYGLSNNDDEKNNN